MKLLRLLLAALLLLAVMGSTVSLVGATPTNGTINVGGGPG